MGQTPLELAHSMYVRFCAKGNPDIHASRYKAAERREPEDFVEAAAGDDDDDGDDWNGVIKRTWDVCKAYAENNGFAGRQLVSVNEAREVARRLAERRKKEAEEKAEMEREKEKEKEEGGSGYRGYRGYVAGGKKTKGDEVDEWLPGGAEGLVLE
ncbi:MAG: hypothetical protein LQ338_008224 [Usnochroma carphineum]|nr:MAG: hypothetical protein LQ338_008224 [Usnochroma carphineum]